MKMQHTIDSISQVILQLKKQISELKTHQKKLQILRIAPQDLLGKIKLHQTNQTVTPFIEAPQSTVGLLIQIYYYHAATNNSSHGYLDASIIQKGDTQNIVNFHSTKFNWYANTSNETEIIPWDSKLPQALQIKLTNTYNTQPNNPYEPNYYQIRLVGYLIQ